MEIQETDEWLDEDRVGARRAQARSLLPQIARQLKQALDETGIDLEVFLVIPESGDAFLSFGTLGDPDGELWDFVGEIIATIARRALGMDRVTHRTLACASTLDGDTACASGSEMRDRIKDRDIEDENRFRLPPSHPHLAEISIDPADWFKFAQMADENPATRIVAHDEPRNERMIVYVACGSKETRRRLQDGWD